MNCHDIKQKLSAYAEGIVPSEEKILIEEHLKLCPKCNESLMDLSKTIDYIHNLEDVEPPAWFTLRVMAKIKAEVEPKKGILQKLFYPLHIKLPIEAVTAALVAVLTIYIFKTMQPEMKLAQAPSEVATTKTPLSKVESFQKDIKSKEEMVSPPISLEKGLPLLEKTTPPLPPLEKGGKGGFEAEQLVPSKKPAPIDKLEEIPQAPAPVQRQDEVKPSAGAVVKEDAKTEVLSRAAKSKLLDKKREVVNITVLVKDIKTARTEVETALTQLGGNIIITASFENKEIVIAEIDSQKFKEIIANLKSIGDVEEKKIDFQALEGNINISIAIMK